MGDVDLELTKGNTRVMTIASFIKSIDILFDLLRNDVIDFITNKTVSLKSSPYGIPAMTWKAGDKFAVKAVQDLLQYKDHSLWWSDGYTGWQKRSWDLVSTINLLKNDHTLSQKKAREKVVFVKAKKTRAKKSAWANVRIPHR